MIHIAVLMKQYMDLVLEGAKTVECRLTRQARAPYDAIEAGERIYFKQSAGPYRATAIADHVLFESELTPKRVGRIRRDYNDLLLGDDSFWRWKRDSRFCTLIWLKDVEPIDNGPAIRPLQGVAWLTLDEDPAWRRRDTGQGTGSFHIEITPGNLRNSTLYVTRVMDRFPKRSLGGNTRQEAGMPLTLVLHEGPQVQTDIVASRRLLRTRVWGRWFRTHGARAGDHVVFTPVCPTTFFVGLARATASRTPLRPMKK